MRDFIRLGEEPVRDVSRVPRAAESKDKVGKIPHRAPEPDSADASLQRDPRPTAAAHHLRYHVQRHGRRRTSRQENVWQLNGINTAQFDVQVLLKLGKTRSSKSGQRSTSVMHQTVAFPGSSSDSKNTAKATCSVLASTRENECRNDFDTPGLQTKLYNSSHQLWTHAASVVDGHDRDLAARRLRG
jgi:hypothetical protein